MKRLLFVCSIALVSTLATFAACSQDEGERCQVNDDCKAGLVCNTAKNTCQSTTGGGLDASVIDAVPADAAVDGAIDAP